MSNSAPPKYVRYVPAQNGAQPKLIRMVEAQKDPMEPARFKINQKVPVGPPSPPAPVMHSPPRKLTAEEQNKWKVPPCVSSWKNPRGYTVPLDKRYAFNAGSGNQPEVLNPKFAQLSETLYISTMQHREAIEEENKAKQLIALKEKEKREEELRKMAQEARLERYNNQRGQGNHHRREGDSVDDEELEERMKIRDDRHRERVRNVNIKSRDPTRRTNLDREKERDISEKIALGLARPDAQDKDVHDQRLYNQSQGLHSGFGEDDDYNVYDKAWKSQASYSTNYRPSDAILKQMDDKETQGDDEDDRVKTSKSGMPAKDALAPIQFEKDDDDEDVFNIESFLKTAKYSANSRKMMEQSTSHSSKRHKS